MNALEIGAGSGFSDAGGGGIGVTRGEPGEPPTVVVAADPDWGRVELVRRVACALEDGALLALAAARPHGAEGHGDESLSAALINREGEPVELADARLTTEYDPTGAPRRFGVELLTADEEALPLRGAGTLREPGLFDFALNGSTGVARYEIARQS